MMGQGIIVLLEDFMLRGTGFVWSLAAAILPGCASDPEGPPTGTVELIGRDWSVPTGEHYKCLGIQVEQDMYIRELRTFGPLGEHHTVLTVTDRLGGIGGTQLGEYDCNVLTVDLQMLYASGVGTPPLAMPDGVALEVRAGQYLHLNLHLFNATDDVQSARSGIEAVLVEPVPTERLAEMVFVGTFDIDVAPGETRTHGGGCTFTRDATLFGYWPHMHQFATHHKLTVNAGGTAQILHDEAYDFEEQRHYPITPTIAVKPGDSARVDCTYTNTSGTRLRWGDSSNEEMCFSGLYRYPKQATSLFDCTER
jgi:hypothetical protein